MNRYLLRMIGTYALPAALSIALALTVLAAAIYWGER